MGDREHLTVALRLVHELKKEGDRFSGCFVGANASQHPQGPRSVRTRNRRVDHGSDMCLCASGVPGLIVQVGGFDGASDGLVGEVAGGQLARTVEEERSRT
jgi:hypothetical protein